MSTLIFLVAPETNMQNICFWFVFLFVFVICMEQDVLVCIDGSFTLFNFLWFCLYCMYFFKGFWGRPQKYRSTCERGRTCLFTGYPPYLQLQGGLLCTCIIEAPNKNTLWLACEKMLGSVWYLCWAAASVFTNIYTCLLASGKLLLYDTHTGQFETLQLQASDQLKVFALVACRLLKPHLCYVELLWQKIVTETCGKM